MTIDEPQNARSRRTRDAILAATFELLHEGGVGEVTMSAVAKRAGCSRRALYLHFGSRTDLLIALRPYVDEREGHAEELELVLSADGPVSRLRAFAGFLARYHAKIAPLVKAMIRASDTDEDAAALTEDAMRAWRGAASRIVAELVEHDLLHDRWDTPDDAIDFLFGMMTVDLIDMLMDRRGWSAEKFARYVGDSFVAMLVSDAGS